MGLLDMLMPGGQTNPFASWFDQNQQKIVGGLGGLATASPNDPRGLLSGLVNGVQGGNPADQAFQQAQQAQAVAKARADAEQAKQAAQIKWLQDNAPQYAPLVQNGLMAPEDVGKQLANPTGSTGADPSKVAEYKFYANQELTSGRPPLSYAEWSKGSNQTQRSGLGQPIWGKDKKTGEYVGFEPMSDGSISSITRPDANPTDFVFDPGTVASDRAAGGAYGQAQGAQQFNLPAAKQNIDIEMTNIDAISKDNVGLDQIFGNVAGVPQQWLPTVPGTPKANLQTRISQVVGENFLQAYSSLKGAGAITEVEGAKAQDAMARLSNAQSKDSFLQALNDLKAVLKLGYDRMSNQAAGGPYQSTGYTPPPLAGKNYVYNPTTGELE